MKNYELTINLLKVPGAFTHTIQGSSKSVKCICLPLDSYFYEGEKGIYLNAKVIERKQVGKYGDTHFIKLTIDPTKYKVMTNEEREAIPIIGNARSEVDFSRKNASDNFDNPPF
jgi:hypothetical protein